jgi:uncharacterized protein (TIGR02145 family)
MKNFKIVWYVLIIPFVIACSKKNSYSPSSSGNSVTINGKTYSTVTIGKQIWTTSNYTGPGGNVLYANTADSAITGNYYSATNIQLPAGWRVPTMYDYDKLLGNYSSNDDNNGNVICNLDATSDLLSKTEWQGITGTNATGFNAYPEGYLNYSALLRKATQVGANTTACFLTSTNFAYADWSIGTLGAGNVVLKLSSTASAYNYYTYYAGMLCLPDDPLNIVSAASLRFVRDK